ncbi:hypothetical protein V8C35DRAFT_299844 [Trichoderma chlorosporum]
MIHLNRMVCSLFPILLGEGFFLMATLTIPATFRARSLHFRREDEPFPPYMFHNGDRTVHHQMKQRMKHRTLLDLPTGIPSVSGRNAASAVSISMLGFIHGNITPDTTELGIQQMLGQISAAASEKTLCCLKLQYGSDG